MTTRPDNAAQEFWRGTRTKRPCNLVRIHRADGVRQRFTDHDRTITFEGETYIPATFAGMSNDRRESTARPGNQELYGLIDQANVVLPDLFGDRYRGAEVFHVITDWAMPWLVVARFQKIVRAVNWVGSRWVATLEAHSQILTRPAGGGLGGAWGMQCPKVLGSTTGTHPCYALISPWTIANVEVQTVTDDRMDVRMTVASWPGNWVDGEYAHGEIEWTTGDNDGVISPIQTYWHSTRRIVLLVPTPFAIAVGDKGTVRVGCDGQYTTCTGKFASPDYYFQATCTAAAVGTITDAALAMTPDLYIGSHVYIVSGTGAGQSRLVTDNDATTLTITPNWVTIPGVGAVFQVRRNNGINFGGNPLDPSAAEMVEPAEEA